MEIRGRIKTRYGVNPLKLPTNYYVERREGAKFRLIYPPRPTRKASPVLFSRRRVIIMYRRLSTPASRITRSVAGWLAREPAELGRRRRTRLIELVYIYINKRARDNIINAAACVPQNRRSGRGGAEDVKSFREFVR